MMIGVNASDVDFTMTDGGRYDTALKKKRGRPPKGTLPPHPRLKKPKDEEDVCFICFDGGSLVLCDYR
ncbi:zinc finger CCCH domain-containing protein 44-like, partial [Trifolium medium]|nr:zinc finger CCCH domain-containing protein 44-like [Trifolium medium]